MILTVTLNPCIDRTLTVFNFREGGTTPVSATRTEIGGKGLNVSKPASIYGAEVVATGFVGGHAGNYIEDALKPFGIKGDFYHVDAESRSCINIWDEVNHVQTEFLEPGFTLTEEDFIPKITIDVPMPIGYVTEHLIEELSVMEPFGKGNEKPLFAEKNLNILSMRILGKNRNTLKMQVRSQHGTVMDALYFGDIEQILTYIMQKYGESETEKCFQGQDNAVTLSFIYYPSVNEYRG